MSLGNETRPHRTAEGVGLILASVLAMAFADAMVKLVSGSLSIWQVFTARSLVAVPIVIALLLATGISLRLSARKWTIIRSVLLVLCWLAYYASLPMLSLSVAAVAVYTGPIWIALLSAMLIGEPVSARQWGGVLLGFLGVIAILKPGSDAFSWFTLLPLLAAALYALAMVLTRSKCREEPPLILAFALHSWFLITGLGATAVLVLIDLSSDMKAAFPFLLGDWARMGMREWGLMAVLGVLSAAYFLGVARAYQIAAPSIIATFDYTYLASAALWGFVFFSEEPDLLTIGGMILITLAGVLVAMRSSRRAAVADTVAA